MDTISPPIAEAINFLASLYSKGLSLSAICTARSALSCYLNTNCPIQFGELPSVKRIIKGIFESKPVLPLQSKIETWDPNTVITFLQPWCPLSELSLKELSLKMTFLLALLSGQRCQTLHALDINYMKLTDKTCTFFVNSLLKHSKKGKHQAPLEFKSFPQDPSLCIVTVVSEYLKRTQKLRKNGTVSKFLLSFQKPHNPISKDTISRWIKTILEMADIDITKFTAHSTRAASTSAALSCGVPVSNILAAAGWSQETTFSKFYNKNIKTNFGQSLVLSFYQRKM